MAIEHPYASLIRRFAAMFYDAFLVIAVLMLGTVPLAVMDGNNDDVGGLVRDPLLRTLYQVYLYYLVFLFYYVFWRLHGQTLGMQVWKIRAEAEDGTIMTPRQCIVRFAVATVSLLLCGAGFFWALFDPRHLTWHDRVSHSRVVYLGKRPYQSERS